jgi:phage shock protein PspC (stress-responsive transcriptional regulator)
MSATEGSIPRRRLVRRREGRVLAGVCTGLADLTGLDVVVFRIGFVLLSIAGASGILAYLLAAIFIPGDEDGDAAAAPILNKLRDGADRLRRLPTWLSVVLIVIGAIALAGAVGTPHPAVLWGIALIAIGVLLLHDDTRPVAPPRDTPLVPRAGPDAEPVPPTTTVSNTATKRLASSARTPRRRRERSPLPWITLSLAFVVTGLTILADQAGMVHLQLGQFFGIALATLGAGLLVAVRWGRARMLIVFSILLLPIALGSSIVKMPLRGSVGGVSYMPVNTHQLEPRYDLLVGKMTLDLSQVDLRGTHAVKIDAVAGRAVVYVPRNVSTTVDGHVQAGDVSIFGQTRSGVDLNFDRTSAPNQTTGKLHLHFEGTATSIAVYSYPYEGPRLQSQHHHKEGRHAKP